MRKPMITSHKVIIGNCISMKEIPDGSVHLMVTSPPYYNAPFDYSGLYNSYEDYLSIINSCARETFRVLGNGRIACLNIDDMLVDGEKFPIVADATRIFLEAGFRYRDRIVWKKPEGYVRISRRSGVMLQHPYPMYFYPDNLLESIIIFQKGKFDYKSVTPQKKDASKIDLNEFQRNKWFLTLWDMTNVLPNSVLEKNIAAFPEELPKRLIELFSFVGETVLDPFLGSGTTMKVARELGRNSIGIEVRKELIPVITEKLGFGTEQSFLNNEDDKLEIIIRDEAMNAATR